MSSYAEYAFDLAQSLPFLISLALIAFSIGRDRTGRWGTELSMTLYLKWSWCLQLFLWIIENNFQVARAHPYEPSNVSWAYPSEVAFWCYSIMAYVVTYALLWEVAMPPFYWTLMILLGFAAPGILVWFAFNTWVEVLTSALLGALLTIPLPFWMRYMLHPKDITLLLTQAPWTWSYSIDTHIRSIAEMERAQAEAEQLAAP